MKRMKFKTRRKRTPPYFSREPRKVSLLFCKKKEKDREIDPYFVAGA